MVPTAISGQWSQCDHASIKGQLRELPHKIQIRHWLRRQIQEEMDIAIRTDGGEGGGGMNLCNDNHPEVCYEGRVCPVCDSMNAHASDLQALEKELKETKEALEEIKERQRDE
jgi:hypothetical protein